MTSDAELHAKLSAHCHHSDAIIICKLRPVPPIVIRLMPVAAGALGLSACRSKVFVAIIWGIICG